MKKLIFTILTTITILGVNAQGNNLQFNRALFESAEIVTTGNFNYSTFLKSNAFTVPSGKVWKITNCEGVVPSYNLTPNANFSGSLKNIGNIAISKSNQNNYKFIGGGGSSAYDSNYGIIWLPSGDYDILVTVDVAGTYSVVFSGIEFNIVP